MLRNPRLRPLLHELLAVRDGIHLTLTLATEDAAGKQEPRRARLIAQAAGELERVGVDAGAHDALLAPLRELGAERAFCRADDRGLALFVAPGFYRAVRLPYPPRERVVAGAQFALRGLLPLADRDARFYVLVAAPHQAHLLEVEAGSVRRLPSWQLRRPAPVALVRRAAALLADPQAPVVLAAGRELLAELARRWPDDRLVERGVELPAAGMDDEALAAAGRELAAHARLAGRLARAQRWAALAGAGRATDQPASVLAAAQQGRVERLFLAEDAELWGRFDPALGGLDAHVERRVGDEDLLERAAVATLGFGGEVESVPGAALAAASPLAALLRY